MSRKPQRVLTVGFLLGIITLPLSLTSNAVRSDRKNEPQSLDETKKVFPPLPEEGNT
jgi:hypothetical protein